MDAPSYRSVAFTIRSFHSANPALPLRYLLSYRPAGRRKKRPRRPQEAVVVAVGEVGEGLPLTCGRLSCRSQACYNQRQVRIAFWYD